MSVGNKLSNLSDMNAWVRYRPTLCKSCWASCCHGMPVEVSVPDLVRLGLITEHQAACDPEAAAGELAQAGVLAGRQSPLVYVLAQKPDGDCIFLDESRRCTVYAKRPEICRQFPRIGPKPGHCPYREK